MMDPHEICRSVAGELASLRAWRETDPPLHQFAEFVQATARAEDILKYGALLYPTFIKVEGVVVRADHYDPENWQAWRKTHDAIDTAAVVNHVHVTDLLYADFERACQLEDAVGQMLAFFWQQAVDRQHPDDAVVVEYADGVVSIFQRRS